jgi:hypothetical protein
MGQSQKCTVNVRRGTTLWNDQCEFISLHTKEWSNFRGTLQKVRRVLSSNRSPVATAAPYRGSQPPTPAPWQDFVSILPVASNLCNRKTNTDFCFWIYTPTSFVTGFLTPVFACNDELSLPKITLHVFWAVAPRSLVKIHRPDDGGSKHLWNVSKLLPDYTAQQPRRQPSSYSTPWEPKISLIWVVFSLPYGLNV